MPERNVLPRARGSELAHRLRMAARVMDLQAFRLRPGRCPLCGPTCVVKLADSDIAVRCARCGASAITMSLARVLRAEVPDLASKHVYELSSRGPLFAFLRRRAGRLTSSEYFDDVPPGESKGGVLCQDVQRLTFADASFDLCTSTEVFEHVPDDLSGFRELRRVLRGGGLFLFTVPLGDADRTVERARRVDGKLEHLLPPEYHGDRIRGQEQVLVFRDYGRDVVERLRASGFGSARIDDRSVRDFWGFGRPVIVARA
jgi:SAM-dependent methyltransferase